jgi:hypothetical protein
VIALLWTIVLAQDPLDSARELAAVKRIYVDKLTGGEAADHIRDILMSSLQGSKMWVITENPDRADAFLRGAADDLAFFERRSSRDGIGARASATLNEGGYQGTSRTNTREDRSSSFGISADEATSATERKREATAAVRLVNKEGDLIWSTTKESGGAKFRGASVDVAEKVARQLVEDVKAARGGS